MNLRINHIVKETKTEGIGIRYSIWVQGCSIRCKGCANRNMWSFSGGFLLEIDKIVTEIKSIQNIEGITILGGEPFDQPEPIAELVEKIKKSGLSVIIFTGYQYEKLCNQSEKMVKKILNCTDLLIDGPYKEEQQDFSRPWVGSLNQRYIFLSNYYTEEDLKRQKTGQRFEVRIQKNGEVWINGIGKLNGFLEFIIAETEKWKSEKAKNKDIPRRLCTDGNTGYQRKEM